MKLNASLLRLGIKTALGLQCAAILVLLICVTAVCWAQKPELIVQTGHSGFVTSVAFSADGKTLASGSFDNTIKLWDVASGSELRTLKGHSDAVKSVAFSADGKRLASGSRHTIKLWDVASGSELRTLEHSQEVVSVAFSADGKTLAIGSYDHTIELWDVASGSELRTLAGHSNMVYSVALSADGKTLASGSEDQTIKLWDVANGSELRTLNGHSKTVDSLAFSADGKTLASGSSDRTIKLWDVASGSELRTLRGHSNAVGSVAFSAGGKTLASGSDDHTIKLWDVASGNELRTLKGHSDWVSSIAFSADGKTLASGSRDQTIKLWDVAGGSELRTLKGHSAKVDSVAFSADGKTLASGSSDRSIKLWDVARGIELRTLEHSDDVFSVALSSDGKTLASGSRDQTIKLWDVASGRELRTLKGQSGFIRSVALSADGKTLASGSQDGTIKLWDVASGSELHTLKGHSAFVFSVAFSADGKTLASGSGQQTITLWDVASGSELRTIKGHYYPFFDWVTSVAFSADGKTLASGGGDHTIKLWDVASGSELRTLSGHSNYVTSVAFSADGKTLASGSWDQTIKLWDVASGSELRTLKGHSNWVTSVAFSADGKTVASGSSDTYLKLWDRSSGRELASLVALDKNDSAIVTPGGLFDASPGGRKLMHYVLGTEVITLDQMKELYYVPGLLKKVMQGDPLPKVELFTATDLFPETEYEQPEPGQKTFTLKLHNRGGGIGQVQILVNGKEFIADARDARLKANPNIQQPVTLTIDLTNAATIAGGENHIDIVASNLSGSLNSRGARGAELVVKDEGPKDTAFPELYAIIGGVSHYTGESLELKYAAKDAEDFARALDLGASRLLGKNRIHLRLLTSDGPGANVHFSAPDARLLNATKSDFQNAFAEFRKAKPTDIFVAYLSGHGVSLNLNQNPNQAAGDTYLYLTQEATSADKNVLSVKEPQRAMSITSDELVQWVAENKALKQVLILDTCAAGAAVQSLVAKRDLPDQDSQTRAMERLKDRTGFFVLMGSAADAVSYEASRYGQGLLTYSLLEGMHGAKLREDQYADVSLLFNYAQDEVPKMARNIGGIQRPLLIAPNQGGSFDIGQFTLEEQRQIPLAKDKPLILRPLVLNEKLRYDNLGLGALLTQGLRAASFTTARGQEAPLVFVDADEMADAITVSGSYAVEGDSLRITLVLVRNNEPVGKEILVTGKASEKDALIKQIVAAVTELAQGL